MGLEADLSPSDLKRFLTLINEQPDIVSPELEDNLVKIAEDISKDKIILTKRDPVENRNSYVGNFIRVDRNSYVIHLNPLDCPRTGGDFDGDSINGNILIYKNNKPIVLNIKDFNNIVKTKYEKEKITSKNKKITSYIVEDDVYINSINIKTKKQNKSKILKFSTHENLNMYKISKQSRNGHIKYFEPFEVSDDHSLVVLNLKTNEIERNTILNIIDNKQKYALIRNINSIDNINTYNILDENRGYFFGSTVGDGYVASDRNIIGLTNCNQSIGNKWCKYIRNINLSYKYYNNDYFSKRFSNTITHKWTCLNKNLHDLFKLKYGSSAENKTFPLNEFLTESNEFIYNFIAGYIDTDGYVGKKSIDLTSKSKQLLENLQKLLIIKYNTSTSLTKYTKKITTNNNFATYYVLHISQSSAILKNIYKYMVERNKRSKIKIFVEKFKNVINNKNNYEIIPFKYINIEKSQSTIAYDLSVENDYTFATSTGIYVFDTFAVYPLFTKKANEEAKQQMNPRISKSAWLSPENSNNIIYKFALDTVATVYSATKY